MPSLMRFLRGAFPSAAFVCGATARLAPNPAVVAIKERRFSIRWLGKGIAGAGRMQLGNEQENWAMRKEPRVRFVSLLWPALAYAANRVEFKRHRDRLRSEQP